MGRKQTTCFDERTSQRIVDRIEYLAANHNCLILRDTMSKLDLAMALQTFIAPDDRTMALDTHRKFHDVLRSDAYKIKLHVDGVNGEWHTMFWWDNATAYADPQCFAVQPTARMYDFQPGGFTTELLNTLEEYVDNAKSWGLVRDVFNWLNDDVVKPRDYAHMIFLMPALQGVIAHFDRGLAEQIGPPRALKRPPAPADKLTALQGANRFLAASYLLPEAQGSGEGPIYMRIQFAAEYVTLENWGREFKPALYK